MYNHALMLIIWCGSFHSIRKSYVSGLQSLVSSLFRVDKFLRLLLFKEMAIARVGDHGRKF